MLTQMQQKYLSYLGTFLFSLGLLSLATWTISRELENYSYQDILQSLKALPSDRLFWSLILTILCYGVMTGYDTLAMRYIRHPLPYWKTAFAAFTSIAVSNNIGFALLSGGAIRYRLYRPWQLSKLEIAQVIAFGNLSFWLGMLTVGGILFITFPLDVPELLNFPFASMDLLGGICFALLIGYFIFSILAQHKTFYWRGSVFRVPSPQIATVQITISTIDWAMAAGVLYLLLDIAAVLSYSTFFGIYLLAQLARVISNVPAGLGILETVMVLMLAPQIPADKVLAALLAYRGIYYLLPFVIASILLGSYELLYRRRKRESE
ncbi:MAG: lysylphosphatidylglycerol synthase domain-containing protein [Spirulinaceae cyanobacterium]